MQETPMRLPLEIWAQIFSHLITTENKVKNVDEIKKIKLVSKSFYHVCDSSAVHKMVSDDFVISTLRLNTKKKRKKFDDHFFTSNQKELLQIFQTAVRYSVIPVIQKAIEKGIDPNQYCTVGYNSKITALCHAAFTDNAALATRLLANPKTDPNIATALLDNHETIPESATLVGETPLMLAAKKNNIEVLKELLKHPHTDLEKTNSNDKTALELALNQYHQMAANILILEQERRRQHTWCESTCHLINLCNPQACIIS